MTHSPHSPAPALAGHRGRLAPARRGRRGPLAEAARSRRRRGATARPRPVRGRDGLVGGVVHLPQRRGGRPVHHPRVAGRRRRPDRLRRRRPARPLPARRRHLREGRPAQGRRPARPALQEPGRLQVPRRDRRGRPGRCQGLYARGGGRGLRRRRLARPARDRMGRDDPLPQRGRPRWPALPRRDGGGAAWRPALDDQRRLGRPERQGQARPLRLPLRRLVVRQPPALRQQGRSDTARGVRAATLRPPPRFALPQRGRQVRRGIGAGGIAQRRQGAGRDRGGLRRRRPARLLRGQRRFGELPLSQPGRHVRGGGEAGRRRGRRPGALQRQHGPRCRRLRRQRQAVRCG